MTMSTKEIDTTVFTSIDREEDLMLFFHQVVNGYMFCTIGAAELSPTRSKVSLKDAKMQETYDHLLKMITDAYCENPWSWEETNAFFPQVQKLLNHIGVDEPQIKTIEDITEGDPELKASLMQDCKKHIQKNSPDEIGDFLKFLYTLQGEFNERFNTLQKWKEIRSFNERNQAYAAYALWLKSTIEKAKNN